MKRLLSFGMAILILSGMFSGCSFAGKEPDGDKLKVVTTLFASYDFARAIVGDKAQITLLIPPGSEAHSYEPTPQDIIKIQKCDVFIYNGGESEKWVSEILKETINPEAKVVKMMDAVGLLEEEFVEGMEAHDAEEGGADHTKEFDEHVWASPKNAVKIVETISKAVREKSEENRSQYEKNTTRYVSQLKELDRQFEEIVANGNRKTVVFGDRFPLQYFVHAYGLSYYAAFPGCSAETEPSAATVAFLINKVKMEKIPVVFHIELSNQKMADTICEATGAKKRLFSACHNVSKADFDKGVTYLDLMKQNAVTLKEALSE